jgi:hypothetical protein
MENATFGLGLRTRNASTDSASRFLFFAMRMSLDLNLFSMNSLPRKVSTEMAPTREMEDWQSREIYDLLVILSCEPRIHLRSCHPYFRHPDQ